ncbi:auxin-responsive protein IAA32-like isoform X1 [Euphorbia lathyris]|uniref:auxin-responsive protein IAA32-like isoform X1 n=1 Tax=Euphorbia lathyris TaxID=212925 RepID=UPI003313533C
MDTNASGFFLNPSSLHSVFYQGDENDGIIDLGLSLKTSQPQSGHWQEGYDEVMGWAQGQGNTSLKHSKVTADECEEEVVQSRESWGYVKVNMDGVVVGRKIYILNYGDYSTLALQLEHMFGKHQFTSTTVQWIYLYFSRIDSSISGRQSCGSGLRLFHPGSEFCLLYKDREDNWRSVGDVPWKEFVECVKRLRIARRN